MESYSPLFETRPASSARYKVFAASLLVSISTVLIYRWTHFPGEDAWTVRWWGWLGMLGAETWFGIYWILAQSLRWSPVRRSAFKAALSQRYEEQLPRVDVFVCTADPEIEPPEMVVNTVLSVMAYDYPPEKLSVYLSDDGGSRLTFYALWEAANFARHWLPYCRSLKVVPASPAAYFKQASPLPSSLPAFTSIKKRYEEMANRIEESAQLGRVPEEVRGQQKGFSEWDHSYTSKHDHPTILQILINGRSSELEASNDVEGVRMPNLVYLAREKRPQHHHNFKAGAMNALIRVSSKISNGPVILNVDCDMYSNDTQSIRDALCFFMDEKQSQDIGYVQFPQVFHNMTKNDLYGSSLCVIREVDFHGLDGAGGPLYVGSGCFHLREVLCGRRYHPKGKDPLVWGTSTCQALDLDEEAVTTLELERNAKDQASCAYELNTQWGNEVGLKYGCPVEDVITGLSVQCRGWKSAYYNPKRPAFLGIAPTSLNETLVQNKRWAEGDFQIILSKYCPLWFGRGRISLLLQMGYLYYCSWAINSFPVLYYSTVPSLFLISRIPLFPRVSSPWFIPFAYIIMANYGYSLVEFLRAHGTILGWWNEQRMWLYKRVSSYLLAFVDSILKLLGFSNMKFVITSKVADDDVTERYNREKMEFGVSSPMFTILTTLALLNLSCLVVSLKRIATGEHIAGTLDLQVLLCGVLGAINMPLYGALFLRKDKGRMPNPDTIKSLIMATAICTCFYVYV